MRKLLVCILCLLLCGCGISEKQLEDNFDSLITSIKSENAVETTNKHRTYFDYFLPRNVGKRFSDEENAVFVLGNQQFYMNLDVTDLIVTEYYSPIFSYQQTRLREIKKIGNVVINKSGEMLNSSQEMKKYNVVVTDLSEGEYLVYVQYGDVYFAALSPLAEVENLVYEMFKIGRSVKLEKQEILSAYSNKETVIITQSYDLFEKVFPENGVVYDVLNPSTNINAGDDAGDDIEMSDQIDENDGSENSDE
ncbi:MAG: hypothetical protein E7191_06585 [Erysipelotrichaceae bacterium]|nr:hypothetical protein [Erysipelotrichaceae bacterium]MBQ9987668.1 hypothetical protein [Erysipelotrichales bacterium]